MLGSETAWESFQPYGWGGQAPPPSEEHIVIAVIDTGVHPNHPDLAVNLVEGWDYVTEEMSDPHGTHVAGIAAAVTNNSVGIAGIAGDAKIRPFEVVGAGDVADDDTGWHNIASALNEIADPSNQYYAHIVNASLGGFEVLAPYYEEELRTEYREALDEVYYRGALLFNAAGNSLLGGWKGQLVDTPQSEYDQTLYVAATDAHDLKADFSNFGTSVDLSAPGVDVLSTVFDDSTTPTTFGYGFKSGTSMATPMASGVAALVWSRFPDTSITPDNRDKVAAILVGTAVSIDELNADFMVHAGAGMNGVAGLLGSGRISAEESVRAADYYRADGEAPDNLPPPRIAGIREVVRPLYHNADQDEIRQLTLQLPSVFKTSAWTDNAAPDPYGVVTLGPMDDPGNWALQYDWNNDGSFETDINLQLDFAQTSEYSDIPGYKVGANDPTISSYKQFSGVSKEGARGSTSRAKRT